MGAGYSEEDWACVWGLLAIDHQTEKMEELQWARLLVKRNGESPPSLVEVWVEGSCYAVTLWWEIRPVMKFPMTEKRGKAVASVVEEGGDASARAGERMTVAMEGSRLEDFLLMGRSVSPIGRANPQIHLGAKTGPMPGPVFSGSGPSNAFSRV